MSEATRPGRFGDYGGQYVAETLMPAVAELTQAYEQVRETETATTLVLELDFMVSAPRA